MSDIESTATVADQHSPNMSDTLNVMCIDGGSDDIEQDASILEAARLIHDLKYHHLSSSPPPSLKPVSNIKKKSEQNRFIVVTAASTASDHQSRPYVVRPPSPVAYPVLRSIVLSTKPRSMSHHDHQNTIETFTIADSKQCVCCPRLVLHVSRDTTSPYCSVAHACQQRGCKRRRDQQSYVTTPNRATGPYCHEHNMRRLSGLKGFCCATNTSSGQTCDNKAFGFLNELYCQHHRCDYQSLSDPHYRIPCYEQALDNTSRCTRHTIAESPTNTTTTATALVINTV